MTEHAPEGAGEKIATNIRKGVLEYCVLALLSTREMYGLELANELVERGLTASEGSLYPLLARLREADAVETRWESPKAGASGRSRRYYAITSEGSAQLRLFEAVWGDISAQVEQVLKERI